MTPQGMTPRGMTPRMGVAGQTPLRTPVRDKLNINQEDGFEVEMNDKYYQVCYKRDNRSIL